jgi:hypothetical protein
LWICEEEKFLEEPPYFQGDSSSHMSFENENSGTRQRFMARYGLESDVLIFAKLLKS